MRKTGALVLLLAISFWVGARDWDVYWNFFAAVKSGDLNTVKTLFTEALRASANRVDLPVAPLVRARSVREQADATGASCPAPQSGGRTGAQQIHAISATKGIDKRYGYQWVYRFAASHSAKKY